MPVTVRELIIQVKVDQEESSSENRSGNRVSGRISKEERKALISECVEQVLQIVNSQKER